MGEYNKSIEELLKDFKELQISEIVNKQILILEHQITFDIWKASMALSLISKQVYATEDRYVNATYNLLINSFQETVYNQYAGISLHIYYINNRKIKIPCSSLIVGTMVNNNP